MGRILSVIRAKSSLDCLPCDRVNLDYGNFGDYQDAGEHPAERPFERPPLPANRRDITEVPVGVLAQRLHTTETKEHNIPQNSGKVGCE
jgi:hypothetical protein